MEGARRPETYVSEERGHIEAGWWCKGYVIPGNPQKQNQTILSEEPLSPRRFTSELANRQIATHGLRYEELSPGLIDNPLRCEILHLEVPVA